MAKRVFLLFMVPFFCFAQESNLFIPKTGNSLEDFVPKGWKITTQSFGDLNHDDLEDAALIIEDTSKSNYFPNERLGKDTLNLNPRYLIILFNSENVFQQKLIQKTIIPSENHKDTTCLADPLLEGGIDIHNNVLSITLHYWLSCGSWYVTNNTYKFRYQNKGFKLIGFDGVSFHRASGEMEEISINYSTKKQKQVVGLNMFDESENKEKPKEIWSTFQLNKLYNLNDFKDEFLPAEEQKRLEDIW